MQRARKAVMAGFMIGICGCGAAPDARAGRSGGEVELAAEWSASSLQGDPLAARADSLVRAGRAWRATALLASRLKTPASAAPEVRLAGARAAAAWDGWTEVQRVLTGAPWLDQQFGSEGRELLVRAALERGEDAVADARLALGGAANDADRVMRRVLLARAYDRANSRDSAASAYLAAAARLPRVADWLRLRAAGVTADSAARSALFARVSLAPARARISSTDAQARERAGDFAGAARSYRAAGAAGSAYRVDALAARDDASRHAVAQRIVAFLALSPSASDTRQSLEVLEELKVTLAPTEELTVARAAASAGVPSRAVAGFTRSSAATPLAPADRMTFASVLGRTGRVAEAARLYASLAEEPTQGPLAAYQRARLLLQTGDGAIARVALRAVVTRHSSVRAAAAPALLLLADLQVDDGDLPGAATSLRQLITNHPDATQAPLARFRAALLRWNVNPGSSAVAFDSLAMLHPDDDEALAARYWAGRGHDRGGRRAEAEDRWRGIIRDVPLSYYAALAAQQLNVAPWTAPGGPDTVAHVAVVDSAVARITALQRLGMDVEARFELEALADRVVRAPAEAAAVAQAIAALGEPARALRIASSAIEKGGTSRALFRAAYPVVHHDVLKEESRRNQLDPALVAGLIRQESSWNPRALSPAGARGLMQLLPSVGASIAAGRRFPLWSPALLYEPDVSVELGAIHLASSLRRGTAPARALAAYNAGGSRLSRWLQRPGASDPELFAEWIPFAETRDYVRIVQRNAGVYRALWGM